MNRILLILTGKDYTKYPEPIGGSINISIPPTRNWTLRLCDSKDGLEFHLTHGPNILHRLFQRLMLGLVWELHKKS